MTERVGEFRTGWRLVLGAFVGTAGGFPSLYFYTAGLFIKPLANEFGWTRGEASLGAIATLIGNVVALPIAGRLVDRFGERRIALLSGLGLSACFVLLGASTTGLASWLTLVLLLSVVSAGSNSVSYNRAIVRHFRLRRGLALGLALTGSGFGATVVPPLLTQFMSQHGWRPAYFLLAALAVALTLAASQLLRGRKQEAQAPAAPPAATPQPSILRHRAFYAIGALIFLTSGAVLGTTMHLVPLLTDGGMPAAAAAGAASTLGFAVILSRVFTGHLLDRWNAGWVTAMLLSLAALGELFLASGSSRLVLPGCLLLGLGIGTETDLLAYLLSRRFPVRRFGSAYGAIFAVHALGAGLGGFAAGAVFDRTGGYGTWLGTSAGALGLAALIALATERRVPAVGAETQSVEPKVGPSRPLAPAESQA